MNVDPSTATAHDGSDLPGSAARELVSIGAVSEATGLSARTIRYYEEQGLLPGVRRRSGGRRVYGEDELERLAFIGRLKTMGLSLAEIRELNAVYAIGGSTRAMLVHLEDLLERRQGDLEERIAELAMLRDQIEKYRTHVTSRIGVLASQEDEAE